MMLELLLTRREDRALVKAAQGLRFLVFDELHTYRGRQGADVASADSALSAGVRWPRHHLRRHVRHDGQRRHVGWTEE